MTRSSEVGGSGIAVHGRAAERARDTHRPRRLVDLIEACPARRKGKGRGEEVRRNKKGSSKVGGYRSVLNVLVAQITLHSRYVLNVFLLKRTFL